MTDNKIPGVGESRPNILVSTTVIATAYATAFCDNAAQAIETVGHLAKMAGDPNFKQAASEELATLHAAANVRGAIADKIASDAVDDIKAKLGV
jgi:hypothetical protein